MRRRFEWRAYLHLRLERNRRSSRLRERLDTSHDRVGRFRGQAPPEGRFSTSQSPSIAGTIQTLAIGSENVSLPKATRCSEGHIRSSGRILCPRSSRDILFFLIRNFPGI